MGCDIHAFIEYRRFDYCSCFAKLLLNRQYALFAALADVRNGENIPCVARPKDIPNNLSWVVESAYEEIGSDAHSASWLTTNEVRAAICILADIKYANTEELEAILATMRYLRDPRLVFWFDN